MDFDKIIYILREEGLFVEKSFQKGQDCLIVSKSNTDEIRPVFYYDGLNSFFDENTAANYIIDFINKSEVPSDLSNIMDRMKAADRIFIPMLRPKNTGAETTVKRDFLNLELVYRFIFGPEHSTVITSDTLDYLDMTEEELHNEAMLAAEKHFKKDTFMNVLTILTNDIGVFGAGVITNNLCLKTIYNKIGAFYVLPSSIHEVIVVPYKEENAEKMYEMVCEVNKTEVSERDFLANAVYMFDGENLKLVIN